MTKVGIADDACWAGFELSKDVLAIKNENIVTLWKDLINTDKPFPKEVLKKNNKTLKNLL